MLDPRSWRVRLAALAGAASVLFAPVPALAFTYGNFVVARGGDVVEYRTDGSLVRTIPVPFPPGTRTENDPLGGIMFDSEAHLAVFNGAAQPWLSVYDATTDTWTHASLAGWTTFPTPGFAGLVTSGRDVFVTDFGTAGGPERGVIEFAGDLGYAANRFTDLFDTADLAIGPGDRIGALLAFSSVVALYDGGTKQDLGTVTLEGSVQGIALREDGSFYG